MATPDDLLSMFAIMNTSEREALVEQFCAVAPHADRPTAQFFLEANNWTLQAAIASFFENGAVNLQLQRRNPVAEFVCDVTIGEGESVPPHTRFEKTWRLRNAGAEDWPVNSVLMYMQGEVMHGAPFVPVPPLLPGQTADVSVAMVSPAVPGMYASSWRLCFNDGMTRFFSEDIWAVVCVAEGGTLPLVQALAATSVSPMAARRPAPPSAHGSPGSQPPPPVQELSQQIPSFGSLSQHTFGSRMPASPQQHQHHPPSLQPSPGRPG